MKMHETLHSEDTGVSLVTAMGAQIGVPCGGFKVTASDLALAAHGDTAAGLGAAGFAAAGLGAATGATAPLGAPAGAAAPFATAGTGAGWHTAVHGHTAAGLGAAGFAAARLGAANGDTAAGLGVASCVVPHAERPRFPGPLLIRSRSPSGSGFPTGSHICTRQPLT